jgi:hypothetical protein
MVTAAFDVDESRRVYIGSTQEVQPGDERISRVFMYKRVVDPDDDAKVFYDRAWTLEIPGLAKKLVARAGSLWVSRDVVTGSATARVTRYDGVTSATPVFASDAALPYPVRDISLSERGDLYFSCPSNTARGGDSADGRTARAAALVDATRPRLQRGCG